MLTTTLTREALSLTRVRVSLPDSEGRALVSSSTAGPHDRPVIRPVLMASDSAGAKVSLMPEGALLLAHDAIAIEIAVGPGARLDLVEPGGTVAYPMHGGKASWQVTIDLAPGATLVWAGEPFVVASGAVVERRSTIRLGLGAKLAWRETVVLGRHGESSGSLSQSLEAFGSGGAPLLHEELEVGPGSSHLLLGGARAIGSVVVLGERLPPSVMSGAGTRLDLDGEGTLVRHLAMEAHLATSAETWVAARCAVG